MMGFNVLPKDRDRLTGLLALNRRAKEQRDYFWQKCYFHEAYGWEEIMNASFNEIKQLVRECTEVNQIQTMLEQLNNRLANDPTVNLSEIEKRVMTDGRS